MTIEELLTLLQFSDGLLPAGAFAHSFGLETLISEGRVTLPTHVAQVVGAYIRGELGPWDAVFAVHALRYSIANDLDACVELDHELEAAKCIAETRAASRQLGRQTIRIAASLFDYPLVTAFARVADEGRTPSHQAIVFGAIGGACGWTPEATAAALLYSAAAAMIGAATRLVPLGQMQAQRLLSETAPLIAPLAALAARRPIEDAYTFAPVLEVAAMRHARLDARLFRS